MIRVQREDFDIGRELAALTDGNLEVGGLGVFVGLVREMVKGSPIQAMTLEQALKFSARMLEQQEHDRRAAVFDRR